MVAAAGPLQGREIPCQEQLTCGSKVKVFKVHNCQNLPSALITPLTPLRQRVPHVGTFPLRTWERKSWRLLHATLNNLEKEYNDILQMSCSCATIKEVINTSLKTRNIHIICKCFTETGKEEKARWGHLALSLPFSLFTICLVPTHTHRHREMGPPPSGTCRLLRIGRLRQPCHTLATSPALSLS